MNVFRSISMIRHYSQAYRHNLKVLQQFDKDNFPLKRYIVDVDEGILPPPYLTEDAVYQITNGLSANDSEAIVSSIEILREWPPCSDLNMDESQYEAFRAALTKQLAIIQGPPGKISIIHH